jgi:hypothetical protein
MVIEFGLLIGGEWNNKYNGERRRAGKLPGGELSSHLVLPAKFHSPPVLLTHAFCSIELRELLYTYRQ